MTEAGRDLVLKPAKKVNPRVKVIIKYPNWYDHFQGLGFNLEEGPQLFDGVWTGTETRDPAGNQHLQNYLAIILSVILIICVRATMVEDGWTPVD